MLLMHYLFIIDKHFFVIDNFDTGSGLYSHDYYGPDVSNHCLIYPHISHLSFTLCLLIHVTV